MAINQVILELSKQISVLKEQYDELARENNRLIKKQKTKKKNAYEVPPALNAWRNSLAKNKEQELLTKFADRIASIKKKDPGWNPPKEFFDI